MDWALKGFLYLIWIGILTICICCNNASQFIKILARTFFGIQLLLLSNCVLFRFALILDVDVSGANLMFRLEPGVHLKNTLWPYNTTFWHFKCINFSYIVQKFKCPWKRHFKRWFRHFKSQNFLSKIDPQAFLTYH